MSEKLPVRAHARARGALGGPDAQALEGALTMTERERDEASERVKALEARLVEAEAERDATRERWMAVLWSLITPTPEDTDQMSDEARTPKEAIYDEKISPLMAQILSLCKEHKINMAATFSLDYDPEADETLFCTSVLPCDESDEKGYERVNECRATMYPQPQFAAFTITTHKAE
jgi:hypothetical protein